MNKLIGIIKNLFNSKNWRNANIFLFFALVSPNVFVNETIGLLCFIWGIIGFIYYANKWRLDLK